MPVNNDYSHRSGESATYTQSLTDQLGLKVVGAYIEGRSQQFIDFEELDENLFQVPGAYHDQQSSGEAQLTFKNDLVNAVGGVFYMDSTACGSLQRVGRHAERHSAADGRSAFGLYITELVEGLRADQELGRLRRYLLEAHRPAESRRRRALERGSRRPRACIRADYTSFAPTQLLPNQQFFNPATGAGRVLPPAW